MGYTNFFRVTDEAKYAQMFSFLRDSSGHGVKDYSAYAKEKGQHGFSWRGSLSVDVSADWCRLCPAHNACPFAEEKPIFSCPEEEQESARYECATDTDDTIPEWYAMLQAVLPEGEAFLCARTELDQLDVITTKGWNVVSLDDMIHGAARTLLNNPDMKVDMVM